MGVIGLNSEFITTKSITGTYFDTKLSRFGLAGSAMAAILKSSMFISLPFEELERLNLEFNLITSKSITGTHFGTIVVTFHF